MAELALNNNHSLTHPVEIVVTLAVMASNTNSSFINFGVETFHCNLVYQAKKQNNSAVCHCYLWHIAVVNHTQDQSRIYLYDRHAEA
jgi:hypothetical protein